MLNTVDRMNVNYNLAVFFNQLKKAFQICNYIKYANGNSERREVSLIFFVLLPYDENDDKTEYV